MFENIGKYYVIDGKVKPAERYVKRNYSNRIYEVIRLISASPLYLEDHFVRLQKSADLIDKKLPLTIDGLKSDIKRLLQAEMIPDNNLMLICYYNENTSWYIIYYRKSVYPVKEMYKTGVKTGLLRLERNLPNAKILDVGYRETVSAEIIKRNLYEIILVNRDGVICEGSKSNIFFYKNNIFYTPPKELILEGITRKYVIESIKRSGFEIIEAFVHESELDEYNGAFLTGTSIGALPIKQIDNIIYAGDMPYKLI